MGASLGQRAKRAAVAARDLVLPARTAGHLKALRLSELDAVVSLMPPGGRLLEIGAGTGWQAREMSRRGYAVTAVDVADSNYRAQRVWDVADYDGHVLPCADRSFDIVFSSNTLEHIPHLDAFEREMHRVLDRNGRAIHVLPSGAWRFWTNLTEPLRYLSLPRPHGEHAANALAEIGAFSRRRWTEHFERTGWVVQAYGTNGLFYTGTSLADRLLSLDARRRLARILGSACHVFVLAAAGDRGNPGR